MVRHRSRPAVLANRFYVFTHPEMLTATAQRFGRIVAGDKPHAPERRALRTSGAAPAAPSRSPSDDATLRIDVCWNVSDVS
jgi:hypothetical protein